MAGLKKTRRAKDTGRPTLVFLPFLIIFAIPHITPRFVLFIKHDTVANALAPAQTNQNQKTAPHSARPAGLSAKQDRFSAHATAANDKDQQLVLRDANTPTTEMTKLIQVNGALNQQIVEQEQQRQKVEKNYQL